jgi:hypothetical protein
MPSYEYEGPPAFVVALGVEVRSGDVVEAEAGVLDDVLGFKKTSKKASSASDKDDD